MSYFAEKLDRVALPVIPLHGLVVFPGMDTSFEVARAMTVRATEMALKAFISEKRTISSTWTAGRFIPLPSAKWRKL